MAVEVPSFSKSIKNDQPFLQHMKNHISLFLHLSTEFLHWCSQFNLSEEVAVNS